MSICKDCIHYEICDEYVSPCESFPETDGCKCFKVKADVVEVIRCRDCANWDKDNIEQHTYSSEDSTLADFAECTRWSNWSVCRMTRFNDYCSCAERREKET